MCVDACAIENAAEYYDQRHERGWMDYWPDSKKDRVVGMIRELGLNSGSKVLEYGCGTGVFTEAMHKGLPGLKVHGCDISASGLQKSRRRCPDVPFFLLGSSNLETPTGEFDAIYSHHVLEHVTDLSLALETIAELLKPSGRVLHILPCGNLDSFEQRISGLTPTAADGTGRFVTDDCSHVRRLSSADLIAASAAHGLELESAQFANQFWGGIDYLSNYYYGSVLLKWVNPKRGRNLWAKVRLLGLSLFLYPLAQLRHRPSHLLRGLKKRFSPTSIAYVCLAPIALISYPLSWILNRGLAWLSEREWRCRNAEPNGSEMYLLFRRRSA